LNKYRNIQRACNAGHKHDSIKEASYCDELALRVRARDIESYEVQKKFTLQPNFKMRPIDQNHIHPWRQRGEAVRAISYIVDFKIVHNNGMVEYVDVKGGKATQTDTFKIKWKLLKFIYKDSPSVIFTIAD